MAEIKAGTSVRTPDGLGMVESTYETDEGSFAVVAYYDKGAVSYPVEEVTVLVP